MGGLGLGLADAQKDIALAVREKKTESQAERVEANSTERIWRRDQQEKRNHKIQTEDVTEISDGCYCRSEVTKRVK